MQENPSERGVQAHVCPTLCQNVFLASYCFRICTSDFYSRHTKVLHPTRLLPHEIQNSFLACLPKSVIKLFLISSLIFFWHAEGSSLFEKQVFRQQVLIGKLLTWLVTSGGGKKKGVDEYQTLLNELLISSFLNALLLLVVEKISLKVVLCSVVRSVRDA